MSRTVEAARVLVDGRASAAVLCLTEPLSFWGGVDPSTGSITDVHHPQRGSTVTGTILVMPSGRGSSSSSSVLAEAIRIGTAPSAIVLAELDPILALGSIVAGELYGITVPVVEVAGADAYDEVASFRAATIEGGTIREA